MRLTHLHILPLFACVVTLSIVTASVRADSVAPPYSYKKATPDGRFLFVMIAPGTVENDAVGWNEQKAAEIRAIRGTYAQSGLYRNDGTTTPLWTVDWYSYDVDVAWDGIHLVRHGPWASSIQDEAFSFFADGQLIRTYTVSDLVDLKFLLPHSASHFQWSESQSLHNAFLRYYVTTKDGNHFVFDITNGSIVEEARHGRVHLGVALASVAALVFGLIAFALHRKRRGRGAPDPAA